MNKIDLKNIKYLSFEGGGGKGIAYLGAVRALEEKYNGIRMPLINIKENNFYSGTNDEIKDRIEIRRDIQTGIGRREKVILGISGSSAGAITAFMVAMGMNSLEVESIFNKPAQAIIYDSISTDKITGAPIPLKFENLFKARAVPISYFEKLIDDNYNKPPMTRVWEKVNDKDNAYRLGTLNYKNYSDKVQWAYLQAQGLVKSIAGNGFLAEKLSDVHMGQHIYCLLHERGMLSGVKTREIFGEIMNNYLLKKLNYTSRKPEQVTFDVFFRLTGVDLVITGSNISSGAPKLFSVYHTPDFPVIEAVSISMNLPAIFKPVMIDAIVDKNKDANYNDLYKGLYIDGGVVNNLPFRVFNTLEAVEINKFSALYDEGDILVSSYNYDKTSDEPYANELWTLAFDLVDKSYKPINRETLFNKEREVLIGGLGGGIFETVLYSSSQGQFRNDAERNNRIEIEITGIPTADFASPRMNNHRRDKFELSAETLKELEIRYEKDFKRENINKLLGDLKNYWIAKAYNKVKGGKEGFIVINYTER